jgi:hypothetical protein
MKCRSVAACVVLLLFALPAHATEVGTSRVFGLGVAIGEPTGIVGKLFVGRDNAVDFGLGFVGWGWRGRCQDPDGHWHDCRNRHEYFSAHADFLWEESFMAQPFRLDWHAGVGGRFVDWYDWDYRATALVGRVPLGLDFAFRRPTWLEAFVEIAPGLMLVPGVDLWIDVSLGARAYF